MWEDILKLRDYSLGAGGSAQVNGIEAFNALVSIRDDLQILCNNLGITYIERVRSFVYDSELNSDYYRVLERLNSVFYQMSKKPEIGNLLRDSVRVAAKDLGRNKIAYHRSAFVSVDTYEGKNKRMRIIFSSESTSPLQVLFKLDIRVLIPDSVRSNDERVRQLRRELITYFTNNFDNGNLDVESLVDNIFNNLELTIIEDEQEGTVREKWWE
tara:strand:+ start:20823 stop:21461 length:639 start_codon:yes stop_codon:yes gene_type:complete